MAPKQQFTSLQEEKLALTLGVLIFTEGMEGTMTDFMPAAGLPVEPPMTAAWKTMDSHRITSADYQSTEQVKRRRNKTRRGKSKKQDAFLHEEGVMFYTN